MSETPLPEIEFDAEQMLGEAQRRAKLEDFGDTAFLESMRVLLGSLENEANLNPLGRVTMYERILGSLVGRLSAQDFFVRHPEIEDEEIVQPTVIVGLARTGSTMMHRLLSADPDVYAVRWWECRAPCPYPGSDWRNEDPRIPDAYAEIEAILEAAPELANIHPWDAEGPDEEIMLLEHAFLSGVPDAFCNVPTYRRYVIDHDMRDGYAYMKRMLQFLQWQKKEAGHPASRWILKAPFHVGRIPQIVEAFPDAMIVQTHRDPLETTPSIASLYSSTWRTTTDAVDQKLVGEQCLELWSWGIGKCLADRDAGLEHRFIDVLYEDTRKNPMASIERIYAGLGLPLTDAAREAMTQWGDENRRDKRAAHNYSLEEFGYTRESICEAFASYRERFIIGKAESGR
ncbi:MAG: sulfotransferase [Myxococcota bacterium]